LYFASSEASYSLSRRWKREPFGSRRFFEVLYEAFFASKEEFLIFGIVLLLYTSKGEKAKRGRRSLL
jgi:hypothetical protein